MEKIVCYALGFIGTLYGLVDCRYRLFDLGIVRPVGRRDLVQFLSAPYTLVTEMLESEVVAR